MLDFRQQPKNEPSLGELAEFLDRALRLAEDLLHCTESLPPVDEDGSSPCADAEELYANKEEKQNTVNWHFRQLHTYLAIVRREAERCRNDLVVVSMHEERIHGKQARAHYSSAEVQLARRYRYLQQSERQILKAMKILDAALARSTSRRFPGRIPQKWPGLLPPREPTPIESVRWGLQRENPDQDIDDLLELDRPRRPDPHPDRPPQ